MNKENKLNSDISGFIPTATIRGRLLGIRKLNSPNCAYDLLVDLKRKTKEQYTVVHLNEKNEVLLAHEVESVIPHCIYKESVSLSSSQVLIGCNAYNNDSLKISEMDIKLGQMFFETGRICGIQLLDYIIVGDSGYVSLKEKGYF